MSYISLNTLYTELQGRLKVLESKNDTDLTKGRISELNLVIIRIQQLLIKSLKHMPMTGMDSDICMICDKTSQEHFNTTNNDENN